MLMQFIKGGEIKMPRLNREDYLNRIQQLVPGDDEESLNLIADLIDSYDGAPAPEPTENWEERYNNLRKQYRERFFNGNAPANDPIVTVEPDPMPEPQPDVDPDAGLTEEEIINKYMPPVEN